MFTHYSKTNEVDKRVDSKIELLNEPHSVNVFTLRKTRARTWNFCQIHDEWAPASFVLAVCNLYTITFISLYKETSLSQSETGSDAAVKEGRGGKQEKGWHK